MAKAKLHSIFSIFLLGLILLSSTGISINAHYCQNDLKGISFFGEAKSCHDKKATCPLHQEMAKKDCCNNKTITLESFDENFIVINKVQTPSFVLDFALPSEFIPLKEYTPTNNHTAYINYRPPPLFLDFQAQFAIFLI